MARQSGSMLARAGAVSWGPKRLLLIDDSAADAGLIREALYDSAQASFDVRHSVRLEEGISAAAEQAFDIALLDLSLPDSEPYVTVTRFRHALPDLPLVVLTGMDDRAIAVRCLQAGAQDYIVKSELDPAALQRSIRMAIALKNAEDEVRRLNQDLERLVRERTADLEAAVKELESFSYSVAHDLRAPLRSIDGFARIVQDEHGDALDDAALTYLARVRGSTAQMSGLVEHLLSFAKIGAQPLERQHVEPNCLVDEVLEQLAADIQGRTVDLVVESLPACEADPILLKQVFCNLLSNALKFTRQREDAQITVGSATTPDGATEYFVRDNGVGFDPRGAGKLFGVFQRLHRATEFEGNGVGLAMLQRIVHRHGGTVRAESTSGEGATFAFTLGKV